MRRVFVGALAALVSTAVPARADDDAGAAPIADTCIELVPKGATRPVMTDTFPDRASSGYAAILRVDVRHGRGERVLPAGLETSSTTEAKKRLKEAGFLLPSQQGTGAARVFSDPDDPSSPTITSHVELPLVPVPESPGRNLLVLPPLPITIGRANGEIMTLCTKTHWVTVEDPIANEPEAQPKPNPPARPQREEWTALKVGLAWTAAGVALAALAYAIFRWWRARPVPPPPPPPPRPPWEVALEQLEAVRADDLLATDRHAEYIDRTSDAVRGYLGARFGFDGLESTTDEILTALRRTSGGGFIRMDDDAPAPLRAFGATISFAEIKAFLEECDLVKFANLVPSTEQCEKAMDVGTRIVRATMPVSQSSPAAAAAPPAPPEAPR